MLSKWNHLAYSHLFSYIIKLFENPDGSHDTFVVLAQLIRSMTQFDPQFEVKMVTHFAVESGKSTTTKAMKASMQSAIMAYASIFYPVP